MGHRSDHRLQPALSNRLPVEVENGSETAHRSASSECGPAGTEWRPLCFLGRDEREGVANLRRSRFQGEGRFVPSVGITFSGDRRSQLTTLSFRVRPKVESRNLWSGQKRLASSPSGFSEESGAGLTDPSARARWPSVGMTEFVAPSLARSG
jgi:hypothetical protein